MKSKAINRIGFISTNVLRQLSISLFNMAIPFMVIHYTTKEIWGSFVPFLLFSMLALQIINWGNKEYLLRQFSQLPAKINDTFSTVLATRLPFVIFFSAAGFLWFPILLAVFIVIWILGRFLNHSVEALVIYEKAFNASTLIEMGSFALFCIAFFYFYMQLDLLLLLMLYSLYQFIKGVAYALLFGKFISFQKFKIEQTYYKAAFQFFLLSVLGFLASKVDVYIIAHLGNKSATADYQVINSLLMFVISLSAFVYAPFTKNIYRNTETVIHKTRKLLLFVGLLVVPVSLLGIYFILEIYLNLRFPLLFYMVAFAYVFPSFCYGIEVVNLFRLHKEKNVVCNLLVCILVNAALSSMFLYYGFGIIGILAGSAIAQVITLVLFKTNLKFAK